MNLGKPLISSTHPRRRNSKTKTKFQPRFQFFAFLTLQVPIHPPFQFIVCDFVDRKPSTHHTGRPAERDEPPYHTVSPELLWCGGDKDARVDRGPRTAIMLRRSKILETQTRHCDSRDGQLVTRLEDQFQYVATERGSITVL